MAKRLAGRFGYPEQPHHFDVTMHVDKLNQPSRWKKPRMIFVCSMGDLFHEDVTHMMREMIFDEIENTPQHIYQVLTKRPKNMLRFFEHYYRETALLPNVWLGVTAENQEAADERLPWLLKTPAAVRFVSVEPMLGHLDMEAKGWLFPTLEGDLSGAYNRGLDWIICGGETGPGAREMNASWTFDLYQQCREAEVPFFFKKPGDAFTGHVQNLPTTIRQWPKVE